MVSVCGLLGFLGLERMTYRYPFVDLLFLPFRTQHGFGVKRQEKTASFSHVFALVQFLDLREKLPKTKRRSC